MNKNIKKATIIAAATLSMSAQAPAADITESDTKTEKTSDMAARRTVGSVLKYEIEKGPDAGTRFLVYHIDQDGDGKSDVVRRRIVPDSTAFPAMQSPFAVIELVEFYDKKYGMWNVTHEKIVNTRKLKQAPIYKER